MNTCIYNRAICNTSNALTTLTLEGTYVPILKFCEYKFVNEHVINEAFIPETDWRETVFNNAFVIHEFTNEQFELLITA